MSAKDILKLVEEKEAKFIDYRFTNTQGKEQHVTVTATEDGINTDCDEGKGVPCNTSKCLVTFLDCLLPNRIVAYNGAKESVRKVAHNQSDDDRNGEDGSENNKR